MDRDFISIYSVLSFSDPHSGSIRHSAVPIPSATAEVLEAVVTGK